MTQWYRKELGAGPAVFQSLRELRDARRDDGQFVDESSLLDVALDLDTETMYVFISPAYGQLAMKVDAEPCASPIFDGCRLVWMSVEYHPDRPPLRKPLGDGSIAEQHVFAEQGLERNLPE